MTASLPVRDQLAIEQAAERGWPALETADIDGWLARWSSGGSMRANSVSALTFHGSDLDRALERVRAFYSARGGIARFTITEIAAPVGLDAGLAARGWRRVGDHVTMARDLDRPVAPADASVVAHDAPTQEWAQAYLQGLSADRRQIAMRIVAGVPGPRRFFSVVRGGATIASGLSVADGAVASVQCMATLPGARRTGAATAILGAIASYAESLRASRLYLQADAANADAIRVYERNGFRVVGRYHSRELPR